MRRNPAILPRPDRALARCCRWQKGRGGARRDNANFIATTKEMDKFLGSLGYLKGPLAIEKFMETAAKKSETTN